MKFLVLVLFGLGFIGPVFGQSMEDISDKIWLPNCPTGTSTECDQSSLFPDAIALPFFQSDSVAIGTIVEKDSQNQDSIQYSLDVDFYLKNYQQFDLLTATLVNSTEPPKFPDVLYYNSPVFNEGDLVFVYLKKNDGQYNVLPESFALDKQEVRGPPPDIHLTKSPSERIFQQGEKIPVSGEVRKLELVKAVKQGKQLEVKLMIVDSNDRDKIVFSDIMEIEYDGNYNYFLDTSKISPGKFELEVNYGPSTSGTEITIEPNFKIWTPIKQYNFGILIEEIQCRGHLVLVQKYDGSPACVKPETAPKLIARGWGVMHEQNTEPIIDIPDPKITTNVIDANNQFALDLYSQVAGDKNENIFFSPWSISTAFSIAYEGARGITAEEIGNVFGFIEDNDQRRSSFKSIQEDLNQKDAKYILNTANALWLAPDFEPFPEYVRTARNYYSSEVDTVNFAKNGVGIINDWVNTKTEGNIEELFEPGSLDSRTRLVITNAIYFNGTWVFPFDKELTANEDFFVTTQNTVKVPMMNHENSLFLNYTETKEIGILELPYEGGKLSMTILLPHENDGITSLEKSLSAENISEWKDNLLERKIRVSLPKFTMETDYDLVPELKEMGVNAAFGPADFSGISNTGLFIDQAIHKAFVDVNEVGTEAAAATGISMRESGPQVIRADHPFMFLIQDNETGNILFIGKVMDPTQ